MTSLKKVSPLIHAFKELIHQILSESDEQISIWKEKLLDALGPNGQVILDVIPDVELIIGEQPEVPEVGPMENVNRFNYVFENFINTFAAKDHPLIIFLDDLQWADLASLKLIEMFITVKAEYLYFIGAYRDNEVGTAHPLILTLEEIKKSGAKVENLKLQLLKEIHVNQFISETLSCDLKRSKPLADLCFAKTRGNPFFLSQFIHSLYLEKLIEFNDTKGIWQWDEVRIRQTDITDNVVNLMINKIQKLSKNTGHILSLAACIGNQFDLNTLSIVYGQSVSKTAEDLFEALQEELVLPVDESYKYVSTAEPDSGTQIPLYKFLHDRVQQAAYALIDEKKKQEAHLKIGREMLKTIPEENLEEQIFDIVDQLNLSSELITDENEREKLAQLNLIAGKKAKLSAAFNPAFDYLKSGMGMLKENCWEIQYVLTLSLYDEAAEVAFLCGDFEAVENLAETVLQQAKTVLNKIKVYDVKIRAYTLQYKLLDAVKTGLHVLKLLGFSYPQKPNKLHVLFAYLRIKLILVGKQPDDLINLQEMTDPYVLAGMRIGTSMSPSVYSTSPNLIILMIFRSLSLSLKHGNAPDSVLTYNGFGFILCGVMGNIESGYQFGQLALQLFKKFNVKRIETKTQLMFNAFIRHWSKHIRETIKPLETGFQKGLESGDFEFATYSLLLYLGHSYYSGKELMILEKKSAEYTNSLKQLKNEKTMLEFLRFRQLISIFRGQSENNFCITGEYFNEEKALQEYLNTNDIHGLFHIYSEKSMFCYFFDQYNLAFESATLAKKYLEGTLGTYFFSAFHFYYSLTLLAVYPNASKLKKINLLQKVFSNQRKIKNGHITPQ